MRPSCLAIITEYLKIFRQFRYNTSSCSGGTIGYRAVLIDSNDSSEKDWGMRRLWVRSSPGPLAFYLLNPIVPQPTPFTKYLGDNILCQACHEVCRSEEFMRHLVKPLSHKKNKLGSTVVIYYAFCLDVAQGHMNGAPNETRTHPCRFASLAC